MAVSSKNRRSIEVDGETYLWWVAEDYDSPFVPFSLALTVASKDRKLLVRYHLDQPNELRHVTVLGPLFRGVTGCGGPWRRFRCPAFGTGEAVTPRDVASFVRWTLDGTEAPVEVDYRGKPVEATAS